MCIYGVNRSPNFETFLLLFTIIRGLIFYKFIFRSDTFEAKEVPAGSHQLCYQAGGTPVSPFCDSWTVSQPTHHM